MNLSGVVVRTYYCKGRVIQPFFCRFPIEKVHIHTINSYITSVLFLVFEKLLGCIDFLLAYIFLGIQDLAVQVTGLYMIWIDERKPSYADGSKLLSDMTPDPT
jgi:hypothetical protein